MSKNSHCLIEAYKVFFDFFGKRELAVGFELFLRA
jgi:hypothetical protein